jgi:NitT/TauT family transport system ATP-binding protein
VTQPVSGMQPCISLRNVSKFFAPSNGRGSAAPAKESKVPNRIVVFEDLSLEVRARELAVVVGRSGCGKTTLLRLIAGLTPPNAGEIFIFGNPITGPNPWTITVFQNFSLFPWRTALGNAELPLEAGTWKMHERAERRNIAARALERVGLHTRLGCYPAELSGGMQQRVALARGLVVKPPVLLMDEPFGSLDARTREEMQKLLVDVWHEIESAIILVTHDIQEAVALADRIIVLGGEPTRLLGQVPVPGEQPRGRGFLTSREGFELQERVIGMLYGAQDATL